MVISDTAKTTKNLARQAAKQIAAEPFEILKKARQQAAGTEEKKAEVPPGEADEAAVGQKEVTGEEKAKIEAQGARQLQALEKEMSEIRGLEVFKELQRRIANGEQVPLTDYPELTAEQRETLAASMLAVAERKNTQEEKPLVEPATRPSRRLSFFGKKTQAERLKTHVEKILPPSG